MSARVVSRSQILKINQLYPLPTKHKPIAFIGTGSIAQFAHIPNYIKQNWEICGLCDINPDQLQKSTDIIGAHDVVLPKTFNSPAEMIKQFGNDVVYDVTTLPQQFEGILDLLPNKSTVLLQKPFGVNLNQSQTLLNIIKSKSITASVNHQLRYSCLGLAIRNLLNLNENILGNIENVEINVAMLTPFHLWPWLGSIEYCELSVHSIHYLDFLRSIFGNPTNVFCSIYSDADNKANNIDSSRLHCILNYKHKPDLQISLNVNHHFKTHKKYFQKINILGDKGNIFGEFIIRDEIIRDELSVESELFVDDELIEIPLNGDWMVDSFYGPMANLQRFIHGEDDILHTNVADVIHTMHLAGALIQSHEQKGFPVQYSN